jgi:hypothetical protein
LGLKVEDKHKRRTRGNTRVLWGQYLHGEIEIERERERERERKRRGLGGGELPELSELHGMFG